MQKPPLPLDSIYRSMKLHRACTCIISVRLNRKNDISAFVLNRRIYMNILFQTNIIPPKSAEFPCNSDLCLFCKISEIT